MRSTVVIRKEGMECLIKSLGIVEAEVFISSLLRDCFDCMRRVHTPPIGAKKGYVPGDKYLTKTTYPAACGGVVDYTEWQREYFSEISLDDFLNNAQAYDQKHPFIIQTDGSGGSV